MSTVVYTIWGAIAGSLGFSLLIGTLDEKFRPYPDDMSVWLLYSIPAGAIFGSITGCALSLASKQKEEGAALAIVAGFLLGLCYAEWIPDQMHRISSPLFTKSATVAYDCALYGPGLFWSVGLFAFGIGYLLKHSLAERK